MDKHIKINFELEGKGRLEEGAKILSRYYQLIVPTSMSIGYVEKDYDVIKSVRKAMDDDIKRIESDKEIVSFYCDKGEDKYVNTLEDMYRLKEEYEEWIKQKIMEADIYEYNLTIRLQTVCQRPKTRLRKLLDL